ncbi:hypothetical protein [Demequina lutea]|uniref:Tfp pilus assembly protein PilX n=1 Tax=Demequina lutea TaxID=431489 RepID=A0A7Y9Z9Q6_9MICO|nr:hypothetical protein [Demequina lutea]NYI41359.1 Tfp pilus assembly protein PilX [Demequina lutea]
MMKSFLSIRTRRMRDSDDSGFAMITALLAILVTAMFSIVMLGVIMSQITPTRLEQATTRTVYAAETGINVVVGQIRAAAGSADGTGNVYGDTRQLPCSSQGTVGSGSSALGYSVAISYYTQNPTTQDDAWRQSSTNKLSCSPGVGPSQAPTYALITSTGTGLVVQNVSGNIQRTVEAVYAFQITNTNIPGGFIKTYDGTTNPARFCLQATKLEAGAEVQYVDAAKCLDGNLDQAKQMWIYADDYTIKLAYSTVPTSGLPNLCMTGAPGAGATKITLQPCLKSTDPNGYNQLWSWEGQSTWRGENSDFTQSSYYMSSGTGVVNAGSSYLQLSTGGDNIQEWSAFNPDPRIGAGAAGKATNEIVSYQEFGRCADVTDVVINIEQMIVFQCKQDPNPNQKGVLWNQKWHYDEPASGLGTQATQIYVYVDNNTANKYCLTSVDAKDGFPTFKSCSPARQDQKWTRVAKMSTYDASYLFKDAFGRCMDLGPSFDNGKTTHPYTTIVMEPCSPTAVGQKWNAPPITSPSALGGYWELTN